MRLNSDHDLLGFNIAFSTNTLKKRKNSTFFNQ